MSPAPAPTVTGIVAVLSHPEEVASGLPWSLAFARLAGVPLTLLHVVDPVNTNELAENAMAMAGDMLSLIRAHTPPSGLDLHTRVEIGMPEMVIPRVASEEQGTVVMLVAGEHGAFARTLLRRGRENVIHHLGSPFVLLPPRIGPPGPLDRAVAGIDGSALADQAVSIARALSPGISILPVEVLEPGSVPADEYLAFEPKISEDRVRMRGRAGVVILSAARMTAAGLIAVGSHGKTGLRGRHLGETAQWLSHHADRPLLVVPAGRPASSRAASR